MATGIKHSGDCSFPPTQPDQNQDVVEIANQPDAI